MSRLSHSVLVHTLFAAGLLSLSAGALAQPPGSPPNGPGGPSSDRPAPEPETRAALKAALEARFDRMDANHDGTIDEKDTQARRDQRIAALFDRIDTDRNGAISKAEFAAAQERRDDAAGPPHIGPGRGERAMLFDRDGRQGRLHGRLPFAPPPGEPGAGRPDRKVGEPLTKTAFVDRGLARFDRIDANHDGTISAAERDAARTPLRGRRARGKMPPPPPTPPQSGQ